MQNTETKKKQVKKPKKPTILKDLSIGMYTNTTRVTLEKLRFSEIARSFVEKAIEEILHQHEDAKAFNTQLNFMDVKAGIPYTLFPDIRKAVESFNNKHKTDFLVLYFRHQAVGLIKENVPTTIPVCQKCRIMVKKQKVTPERLVWWKSLIKFFFRGAYEQPDVWTYECKTHGDIGDRIELSTF